MNRAKKLSDKLFEAHLARGLPNFLSNLSDALGYTIQDSQWQHPKIIKPIFNFQNYRCRWVIKFNEKNTESIDQILKKINVIDNNTIGYYFNELSNDFGSIRLKFEDIFFAWRKLMEFNPCIYFHNPKTLQNFSIEREDEFLAASAYIEKCYIIRVDSNSWYHLIRDILDPLHIE